jgi:hypothetical protein
MAETQSTYATTEKQKVRGTKTTDAKLVAITRIKGLVDKLTDAERSIVFRYLYEDYSAFFPTAG